MDERERMRIDQRRRECYDLAFAAMESRGAELSVDQLDAIADEQLRRELGPARWSAYRNASALAHQQHQLRAERGKDPLRMGRGERRRSWQGQTVKFG